MQSNTKYRSSDSKLGLEPRDRGRNLWLDHGNQTVGDDYSMLKKNVKFRKEIGEKVGVGFKQPNLISSSLVPDVPRIAVEEAEKVVM